MPRCSATFDENGLGRVVPGPFRCRSALQRGPTAGAFPSRANPKPKATRLSKLT
jgi:hypothetical protein